MKKRRSGVPHRRRPYLSNDAVHVTLKLIDGLPSLRSPAEFECVCGALEMAQGRFGVSFTSLSVLRNHMHCTAEAPSKEALARAMKGLKVRIVRALNKLWGRAGSIFRERYFAAALRTVKRGYDTLRYVLNNARRHGERLVKDMPDPFSSGPWFAGWKERLGNPLRRDKSPVVEPRTRVLQLASKIPIPLNEPPSPWFQQG